MESFDIIKPSSVLEPYIKYYWILDYESEIIEPIRVIPYGCVQFTFYLGNRIQSLSTSNTSYFKDQAVVSGQSSMFMDVVPQGKIRLITIVFKPFGAKPFFDFPISYIKNNIVSIKDINNGEWIDLENRLGNCDSIIEIISTLEKTLIKKLEKNSLFNSYTSINYSRMTHAVKEIDKSNGNIKSKELSSIICLSDKQFNRIFTDYIGNNPKEFMRIIKYQSVLYKLQSFNLKDIQNIDFQDLVYDFGYYDQSHLINNFKQFTGYTPKEYIKQFPPCSEYFSM